MAKISTGQGFGQDVAQPQRHSDTATPRAAFGVTEGLHRAGAQMEHQALLAEREAERDALARREAADRAMTTARLGGMRDQLSDLVAEVDQGVQDGTIQKTDARKVWDERRAKVLEDGLPGVPEAHRAAVAADVDGLAVRLTSKVGDAVRRRDQSDTLSGINQTLEYAQRLSVQNPEQARQVATDALDQLGPFAGMKPEQITKAKQSFIEGAAYTRAYSAVNLARTDNAALGEVEKQVAANADLDPQRQAQLLTTIAGFRATNEQRAEIRAARAQRQAEAHLKRAESTFNAYQALVDKGGALDPAYVDMVVKQTAGTPYQAAIKPLAETAAAIGGLAAQPIATQRATLDAIDQRIAEQGRTPALDRRREQVDKVYRGSQADAEKDPLRAYVERGAASDFKPINMSNPQAIMSGLVARLPLAEEASRWAGKPVSPLSGEEIEPFRKLMEAMPPKARAQFIAETAKGLGPAASAGLARQLGAGQPDPDKRALSLAFGLAGSQTTAGRNTSELVLLGQQARKDGTSTKGDKAPDVKAAAWKATAAATLANVFPNPQEADAYRDAAELIMHGIAAEQHGRLDRDDMQRAIRMAIGGTLEEHNGRVIPLPAGVTPDMLDKRLRTITVDDITAQAPTGKVRAAGVQVDAAEFVKSLPGAALIYAGPKKFNVLVGGRPVTAESGRPIVIGIQ